MYSVAVFKWMGAIPSDDEIGTDPANKYSADFGEQWAYQVTQPVAVSVLEAVSKLKDVEVEGTPYFGEQTWWFTARISKQTYTISIWWVGEDDRRFGAQPQLKRGCLASVFLPRESESSLNPAFEVLRIALESHSEVADLAWVAEGDLGKQ